MNRYLEKVEENMKILTIVRLMISWLMLLLVPNHLALAGEDILNFDIPKVDRKNYHPHREITKPAIANSPDPPIVLTFTPSSDVSTPTVVDQKVADQISRSLQPNQPNYPDGELNFTPFSDADSAPNVPKARPNQPHPKPTFKIEPKPEIANLKSSPKIGETIAGYPVTSPFGNRINPVTGEAQFHGGVDLATPLSTPIYAIGEPGNTITLNCWIDGGGGGLVATMTSPLYPSKLFDALHLSWCRAPTNGAIIKVKAGEIIAKTGTSGMSTGPHLHFQIRDTQLGTKLPPSKALTWSVLKGRSAQLTEK